MSEESLPPFLGKSFVLEDTTAHVKRESPLLEFRCFERQGLTVYRPKNPNSQGELEPLRSLDDLKVGMKLLVPAPLSGGYWEVKVTSVSGDSGLARGGDLSVSLNYDLGLPAHDIPAEWVASCLGNFERLARVDFS